jgi:anti-sigma factor RsiW
MRGEANVLDHDEVLGLSGAYALGALDDDEVRAVDAHLEGCPACRRAVESLRETATMLPLTVEDVPPPPALRERVLAAVRAEAGEGGAVVLPLRRRPWPRAALAAAAASAAVVVGGLGLQTLDRGGDGREALTPRVLTAQEIPTAPGATVALLSAGGDHLVVLAEGLPPAPNGDTYVVWARRGGAPENAGTLDLARTRVATLAVPDGTREVLVTVEPDPRTRVPTTAPIVDVTRD